MRKPILCAAYLALGLVPVPASAGWVPITITGFTVDQPKTYGADCAKPSTGTFANVKAVASLSNAALDEDNNCIHFDYQGATIFVHATNVEYPATAHVDPTACQTVALATPSGHVSHVGMGAGAGCTTKKPN